MDLQFECDNSLSNRLHTVQEALDASVYETVDIKVKIMMKSENKQPIVHGGRTTFKTDSIVADETNATKLVYCGKMPLKKSILVNAITSKIAK